MFRHTGLEFLVRLAFSRNPRLVIQAVHWDRGRLARRERDARAALAAESSSRSFAPDGAGCGRDARGLSEEVE